MVLGCRLGLYYDKIKYQQVRDPMTTLEEDCASTAGKSVQNCDVVIGL